MEAATKGYAYLEAHPEVIKTKPGNADYQDTDQFERLQAAGAMYRLTGGSKYNDYVKAHFGQWESEGRMQM